MNAGGCTSGAFVNGVENIPAFEKTIGKKLGVILFFTHWFNPFPTDEVKAIINNGSLPMLTWEPWITDKEGTLNAIISGKHDDYMLNFLKAAKEIGQPIFLRFAHEMNGDWYPWSGVSNNDEGKGPELYIKAWKHLHALIYNNVKATNIKLVWCVNH
jgi:beta-mannanase